jgi:hypothetical protein
MDFSQLSDDDLKAIAAGEFSKMSNDALRLISQQPQSNTVTEQAPGISISYPTDQFAPEPDTSAVQSLGRQAGLTGRALATGATAIPMMAGDAMNQLINMISGSNIPPASQSLQNLMNQVGVPQPRTPTERVSQDVASAMAGVGGTAKLAQTLAPKSLAALMQNLGLQTTGAIGGAGASGAAREGGAPPLAQMGLGLAAGMIAPTGGSVVASKTPQLVKKMVQPFTDLGRDKIAGEVLTGLARNPSSSIQRGESYQQRVPGYQPTTAQATKDLGLISAETPIKSLDMTGRFAEQQSTANQARMNIINRMAREVEDVTAAEARRNAITDPLRENAFAQSNVDPVTFKSAIDLIVGRQVNSILKSPQGKRSTVQAVVKDAYQDIKRANTPQDLYEIRKDLRAMERGLLDKSGQGGPSSSAYKVSRKELNDIIKAVDDVIESAAPGYQDYLRKYASMSKGIESMSAAQDFRSRVISTIPDPQNPGSFILSQPSFARAIRAAKDGKNFEGLSKAQIAVLDKIAKDLDEGVLNRATKMPGSDTFKNMSTANVIGGIIGKQIFGDVPSVLQKIAAPMNWLYNGTDDKIRELLVSAMLDPKLASRLMAKASETAMEPLSKELQRKAINLGYGAVFGLEQ